MSNSHGASCRYDREAWPTPTVVVRETWSDGIDVSFAFTAIDIGHTDAVNSSLDGWEGDGLIVNVTVTNRGASTSSRHSAERERRVDATLSHEDTQGRGALSSPVNLTAWIDFLGGLSETASGNGAAAVALSSQRRLRLCAYSDSAEGVTAAVQGASAR